MLAHSLRATGASARAAVLLFEETSDAFRDLGVQTVPQLVVLDRARWRAGTQPGAHRQLPSSADMSVHGMALFVNQHTPLQVEVIPPLRAVLPWAALVAVLSAVAASVISAFAPAVLKAPVQCFWRVATSRQLAMLGSMVRTVIARRVVAASLTSAALQAVFAFSVAGLVFCVIHTAPLVSRNPWARKMRDQVVIFAGPNNQTVLEGCCAALTSASVLHMPHAPYGVSPAACRLPPDACHLPPATCRLPPAARRLPLAVCRSPLAPRPSPFAPRRLAFVVLTLPASSVLGVAVAMILAVHAARVPRSGVAFARPWSLTAMMWIGCAVALFVTFVQLFAAKQPWISPHQLLSGLVRDVRRIAW